MEVFHIPNMLGMRLAEDTTGIFQCTTCNSRKEILMRAWPAKAQPTDYICPNGCNADEVQIFLEIEQKGDEGEQIESS